MKVAVIRGVRDLSVEERPDPTPGRGEALVAIRSIGVCGSDVHGFDGLIPKRRKPGLIMGHEAAGEIVELGRDASAWRIGERVAIDPQISCGSCTSCELGLMHLCDRRINLGSSMLAFKDGALCEYIAISERQLRRMPEHVSYDEAAMLDPSACIAHLFNRFRMVLGSTVAVVGTGTMGLLAVQVAKIAGASKVIAVDISPSRLELARELGADITIDSSLENIPERILDETAGRGVDAAIEAVGISETYAACVESVRKRGTVVALGYIDEQVPFPMQTLIFKEIEVLGSTGFTFESETVLDLIGMGRLKVQPLITDSYSLDDVQVGFERASDPASGAIKVMIHP